MFVVEQGHMVKKHILHVQTIEFVAIRAIIAEHAGGSIPGIWFCHYFTQFLESNVSNLLQTRARKQSS